jgi:hypothetical protein
VETKRSTSEKKKRKPIKTGTEKNKKEKNRDTNSKVRIGNEEKGKMLRNEGNALRCSVRDIKSQKIKTKGRTNEKRWKTEKDMGAY